MFDSVEAVTHAYVKGELTHDEWLKERARFIAPKPQADGVDDARRRWDEAALAYNEGKIDREQYAAVRDRHRNEVERASKARVEGMRYEDAVIAFNEGRITSSEFGIVRAAAGLSEPHKDDSRIIGQRTPEATRQRFADAEATHQAELSERQRTHHVQALNTFLGDEPVSEHEIHDRNSLAEAFNRGEIGPALYATYRQKFGGS